MSDDYKNILSNFTIPTNWAGFYPQNDVTNKQYRSEIMLEKRSGVQLDGQDLGELWSFSCPKHCWYMVMNRLLFME